MIATLFATVICGVPAFADSVTYDFGAINGGTASRTTAGPGSPGSESGTFTTDPNQTANYGSAGQSGTPVTVQGFSNVLFPNKVLTEVIFTIDSVASGGKSTWTNNFGSTVTASVFNNASLEFFDDPTQHSGALGAEGGDDNALGAGAAGANSKKFTNTSSFPITAGFNIGGVQDLTAATESTGNLNGWYNTSDLIFDYVHTMTYTDSSGHLTLSGPVDYNLSISGSVEYIYQDAPVPAALYLGLIPLAGMVALKLNRKSRKAKAAIPAV